jgi:hypothetical protein
MRGMSLEELANVQATSVPNRANRCALRLQRCGW